MAVRRKKSGGGDVEERGRRPAGDVERRDFDARLSLTLKKGRKTFWDHLFT